MGAVRTEARPMQFFASYCPPCSHAFLAEVTSVGGHRLRCNECGGPAQRVGIRSYAWCDLERFIEIERAVRAQRIAATTAGELLGAFLCTADVDATPENGLRELAGVIASVEIARTAQSDPAMQWHVGGMILTILAARARSAARSLT